MSRNSMTTLRDALFRIEPTRGLVSYTEDVKPYHTKIMDVLIEYVYEERIDVTIQEKWKWEIHWDERWDSNRDADWLAARKPETVTYSCGYGIVWDNVSTVDSNPVTTIVDISPAHHIITSATDTSFNVAGKALNDFANGTQFSVSGLIGPSGPIAKQTFTVQGTPQYMNGRTVIPVASTPTITDVSQATAHARVDLLDDYFTPANSFLVSTALPNTYSYVVNNRDANQMSLADRITIVGVNPAAHTWTISGNRVADIDVGASVYVTSNGVNSNGTYTVSAVTTSGGNTVITVVEPIFTSAVPSGFLAYAIKPVDEYNITSINTSTRQITVAGNHTTYVFPNQRLTINGNAGGADGNYTVASVALVSGNTVYTVKNTITTTSTNTGKVFIERLPGWTSGTRIKLSGTGVQPAPLATAGEYYFVPTPTPGVFNLGYTRYPQQYSDIVDVTSIGVGDIKISRGELYQPGTAIVVDNTYSPTTRGTYYVRRTVTEGIYTRVFVMQSIHAAHGGTAAVAGNIFSKGNGYSEPAYCPLAKASGLYTDTYVHEHLQFTVEVFKRDAISAVAVENQQQWGWGVSPLSRGLVGPYGSNDYEDIPARFAMTTGNPSADGAHVLLPTGYDTQLWDIGGMSETYTDVQNFYGRTLP
jgi:hypothetical protein